MNCSIKGVVHYRRDGVNNGGGVVPFHTIDCSYRARSIVHVNINKFIEPGNCLFGTYKKTIQSFSNVTNIDSMNKVIV